MEITTAQRKKLALMGKQHHLLFIILHGSYAKGTAKSGSDLDIAVLGRRPISGDDLLKLYTALAGVFGDSAERELDVKTLHHVDPLFRYQVVRDGVLLYGDRTAFNEFKAYAFRAFMDSYDLRNLEEKLLRKRLGQTDPYNTTS